MAMTPKRSGLTAALTGHGVLIAVVLAVIVLI